MAIDENEIKFAGEICLAPGHVGRWYLVPFFEATTATTPDSPALIPDASTWVFAESIAVSSVSQIRTSGRLFSETESRPIINDPVPTKTTTKPNRIGSMFGWFHCLFKDWINDLIFNMD